MPAKVFRRAAGGLGLGDAKGTSGGGCVAADGRSAGCLGQKSVAGSSRQGTMSSARPAGRSCPASWGRARGGVGVRCRLPLHWSGGVGDASKPGGRSGEMSRSGRCIVAGKHSSMSTGLRTWDATAAACASSRFGAGGVRSTVVGDSGGDAGGVRASLDMRLAEAGRDCLTGLQPRAPTAAVAGVVGWRGSSSLARTVVALKEPEPRSTGAAPRTTGRSGISRRRPS